MGSLKKHWAQQEKEERDRRHRRKLEELYDEHFERVRAAGNFSPWIILFIALLLVAFFIYFAHSFVRSSNRPLQDAVKTSATPQQRQPPQNNVRRTKSK